MQFGQQLWTATLQKDGASQTPQTIPSVTGLLLPPVPKFCKQRTPQNPLSLAAQVNFEPLTLLIDDTLEAREAADNKWAILWAPNDRRLDWLFCELLHKLGSPQWDSLDWTCRHLLCLSLSLAQLLRGEHWEMALSAAFLTLRMSWHN